MWVSDTQLFSFPIFFLFCIIQPLIFLHLIMSVRRVVDITNVRIQTTDFAIPLRLSTML